MIISSSIKYCKKIFNCQCSIPSSYGGTSIRNIVFNSL
nr:MAG TPA: hypothetical protein [Caudoviricetes sp.]